MDQSSSAIRTAASWIAQADAILICAGAGMSVTPGSDTNVYIDRKAFEKFYPGLDKWGYHTAYECMGLFGDPNVPETVKWGYLARHINNQRYTFPPNSGYQTLHKDIVKNRDYFVWTSNVDGCFSRSGFQDDKIYTPQGDWMYVQCAKGCSARKIYDSKPIVDNLLQHHLDLNSTEVRDPSKVPRCEQCGSMLMGNVRGGDWFLHDPHLKVQEKLIQWVEQVKQTGKRLVILEIGAGWNTPIITRFPMESITRDVSGCHLVRINPTDPQVPSDISAVGINQGWQVFEQIAQHLGSNQDSQDVEESVVQSNSAHQVAPIQTMHWKKILQSLR